MTKELFEKAKFGDRFVTRGGQEALFLRLAENSEWQFADFYVKDWGLIRVNRESGKCLNDSGTGTDIVGMQPSLPSNLDEAAKEYLRQYNESEFGNGGDDWDDDILITFKAGAEWMRCENEKKHYFCKLTDIKSAWNELKKNSPNIDKTPAIIFFRGAEWMAMQGESIESTVVTTQDEDTCRPYLALQNFGYMPAPIFCKESDEVIVQIRKK